MDFEFTSRDTPQYNNLAELSFPHIAGKARAMMGAAHVLMMFGVSWQLKLLNVQHSLMVSG